jgi:hypothetical protein
MVPFFYVINLAQHSLPRQALHQYNISCIVVIKWWEFHWWHHFKVKVKGQGHIMVKVGCQRNPYFLSSFYQIISKLDVKVAYELPLSWIFLGPISHDLHGSHCGSKFPYPKVKFWNRRYHTVPYRVAHHMEGIDECFPNQQKFWRYDVISWRHDVKTEFLQLFFHLKNIIVSI